MGPEPAPPIPEVEHDPVPQASPDPDPVAAGTDGAPGVLAQAQRALRAAKRRYGFPLDAGRDS